MYKLQENLTREWMESAAEKTGYPLLQIEFLAHMMYAAWVLRTEDLILKGGTAVQQHVKEPYRRISVDLDYDLGKLMQLETVKSLMNKPHYKGGEYNKFTGTLTYQRPAPTLYKSEKRLDGVKINAHIIKIQINTRTVSKEYEEVSFNILPGLLDEYAFKQKTLTAERLLANKIVVSARSETVKVGRARYKDLYDVTALINYPRKKINYEKVAEEIGIDLRRRGSNLSPEQVVNSCASNISALEEENAKGFYSSYKVPGEISEDIRNLAKRTIKALKNIEILH
ncbi:MAG: nucleotidyl transferase AbiEii/AbiGii toxin family protein [Candidatus Altiarchaeia archaeon]